MSTVPGPSSVPGRWRPAPPRPGPATAVARRATEGARRSAWTSAPPADRRGATVVASRVTQIDAAGECHVALRLGRMADDDQLLMVRAAEANALIEQHLTAGSLDRLAEMLVLLLAVLELVQVRAPHQALDDDPASGGSAEQLGDRRAGLAQFLVGVAAPVGEEQIVAAGQRLDFGGELVEIESSRGSAPGPDCPRTRRAVATPGYLVRLS